MGILLSQCSVGHFTWTHTYILLLSATQICPIGIVVLRVTCSSPTSTERIVAFPLQQCLSHSTPTLLYKYWLSFCFVALNFKSPVVTECSTNFTKPLSLSTQHIRVSVWIQKKKRSLSLYIINWLVFITEKVYCAVRSETLCITQVNIPLLKSNVELLFL